jgi:hypothetical protein
MSRRRDFSFSRASAPNYFTILPNPAMGGKSLFSCRHPKSLPLSQFRAKIYFFEDES